MWIAEFENQRAFLSKQKPGTVGSQNFSSGTQFAQALTMVHVPYRARNAMSELQARRMRGVEKTRRYWRRMDILVIIRLD